jgi:anaerobic selenocysteine-containing dehydrogenase
VSWDEALDEVAARLGAIAARDPQAILPYSYAGTMGLVQGEGMAARFFTPAGRVAAGPHHLRQRRRRGAGATYGGKLGMHLSSTSPRAG